MQTEEFEKVIIKSMFYIDNVCNKILPELNVEWFSNSYNKVIINYILDFNSTLGRMPNVLEMKQKITNVEVLKKFEDIIKLSIEEINTDYIISEIEEFVRKKMMFYVGEKILKYTINEQNYSGSLVDELSDAESFSFDTNIGFNFFNDPKRLYEDANTKEKIFRCGVKTLDDLIGGGFHEKSLNLFLSSTNVGKTLILCSLTTNFIMNGYKVLYITFEDNENKIAARIAQNMFDVTQEQFKAMSLEDYGKAFKQAKQKAGGNNLRIKEYPESSINAIGIKSLIKELWERDKYKPDILIIDYIGCMIPNGKPNINLNTNTILLNISMQVRAIGMELGMPIISASQTNRGGYNVAEIGLNDTADSFGQTTKADAIFAVTQIPEFREQNMYNIKLLKTRYGNKRDSVVNIGVNIEKQRIYDLNTSQIIQHEEKQKNIFDNTNSLFEKSHKNLDIDIEL